MLIEAELSDKVLFNLEILEDVFNWGTIFASSIAFSFMNFKSAILWEFLKEINFVNLSKVKKSKTLLSKFFSFEFKFLIINLFKKISKFSLFKLFKKFLKSVFEW